MTAYIDSSFLVSLYSSDLNSQGAVKAIQAATADLIITTLGELEVVNAFGLRVFRKEISTAQSEASLRDFEKDLRAGVFRLHQVPEPAFDRARQFSRQTTPKLGTRTADLLHVAAAVELGAERLYSFDKSQRKLAQTVGLKVN